MGKVYAATVAGRCLGLAEGTRVALKVVHPHLLETPGFFKRFLREAEVGKAIVHENVVRTFDADAVAVGGEQHHYLVMEYVEGQTLRELLHELERVPEELCRHVGREVAKGLAAIHAAGVVHRDMKPENVLITGEHVVKVMDLGVARLQDEALRLSQTGAFVGSIHYAAPESFRDGGKLVDGRADLHALGLVLYELSCGVNPYYAESIPEILRKVLHEAPRRLGEINPQLSPFFEEVVHCLLEKAPGGRFADAGTLLGVLEEGESSAWWTARTKAIRAVTHQPLRRIRIPRETAVYGREQDIAALRALYEKAKAGEGRVVLVEGEAGIGKSRVVDELIGRLQRDGEELNFLFGSYPPGGAATASGAFSTAFREQFGADGSAAYLTPSPILVPAFDALLRGEPTPIGVEPLTKDSLQTCFVHALRGLAAERTTVLLIDDLHFATDDARALFTSLAMAVPGHRILLLGTTRPGIDEKWLAGLTRLPQTRQMALHRLGPKDLGALLKDSLESDQLAQSLALQIGQKSDGNPFFVFEIIRGLRDGQFLTQKDDGTWVSTRVIDDIEIPSSILDLVNARVADLTEDERNLLDVAACWGFEFDPLLVGEVLGIARIPLLRMLGQIERQHRLARSSGLRYVFDHHQVQEALYGSLSELLRREYHSALAAALETRTNAAEKDPTTLDGALCVDLCEHFLMGAQGERALRYLDAALTHLEGGWLNHAAIRLAERALAVPALVAGAERGKTLLRLAARLDLLGRREPQRAAIEEALALARASGDRQAEAKATGSLGIVIASLGRVAEAREHFERCLALARETQDRRGEGKATGNLGNVFCSLGRVADARAHYERWLAIAREIGDRQEEANATGNLGNAFKSLGQFAEAREHLERHLAIAREIGDRRGEAKATGNLGTVFSALGQFAEARAHHERHLAIAREIGDRLGEAHATGNLGVVFHSLGRTAEAREHHERCLTIAREIGHRLGEAIALVNLGPLRLALGDAVLARRDLEASLALCREIGTRYPEGYALLGLGFVADEEGDSATALRRTEESVALRREIAHGDGVAGSLVAIGDLRRRAGDADAARAALDEALALARAQEDKPKAAHCLALLANLPGGDAQAVVAAAAEAGDLGEHALPVRLLLWQATRDRAHLAEAKRLLDFRVEHAPPECRGPMLANVRIHREIVAACRADA